MSERRYSVFRWLVVIIPLALVLTACGVNMSGTPKAVNEKEILALPTATVTPLPAPTATLDPNASPAPTTPPSAVTGFEAIDMNAADWDAGFQVYVTACASCHGAGDGVGPSLVTMRDSAATRVAGLSAAEYLYQAITDPGAYIVPGYDNLMPAGFGQSLSASDIANLIKFIQEFDVSKMMAAASGESTSSSSADTSSADVPGGEVVISTPSLAVGEGTPTAVAPPLSQDGTLTVRGRLVQGTAGGEAIPAGLAMQLFVLDAHGNLAGVYDTTSSEDSSYAFENVPRSAGDVYLIQVRYDGIPQGAQITSSEGTETELTQDVIVYQRTTDPSSVAVTWAQMLVNFAPIDQFGVEIWLRMELANTGDRIVTTDQVAGPNDWYVSVVVDLPVGSFGIQPMESEGSDRFDVQVEDGVPVVRDTWPLRPGQVHTITVAYYVPYSNGAVFDQTFNYPVVDASVLLPNDTVTMQSDQLDPVGAWRYRVDHGGVRVVDLQPDETVDPEKDFTLVNAHDLLKPLAAGDHLVFELIGRPTRTLDVIATTPQAASSGSDDKSNTLPVLIAAVGLALIGVAGVLAWRQRRTVPLLAEASADVVEMTDDDWEPPSPKATKAELLSAVASLDDAFEAGELDEDTYEERRAMLMERLIPLMGDDE